MRRNTQSRDKLTTFKMGVAIDPTCIHIGRLERTEPNLIRFKWGSRVNRHFHLKFQALVHHFSSKFPSFISVLAHFGTFQLEL